MGVVGSEKIVDLKSPSVCTSLPLGSERDVGKERVCSSVFTTLSTQMMRGWEIDAI